MRPAFIPDTCRGPRTAQLFYLACALAVVLAPAAGPARADGGGSAPSMPSNPPPTPAPRAPTPEEQAAIARQEAEREYAAAYRDVEKAQQERKEATALREAGDEKSAKKAAQRDESAQKRLAKGVQRFARVVAVIPDHANAWNMLGYTKRMTGDTEGAFEAYWKCLELDPGHAGAHEYLGEAYLMTGKIDQARGELAWLEKKGAKEAATLAAAIAAWEKANPGAARAPATPATEPVRTAPVPETK